MKKLLVILLATLLIVGCSGESKNEKMDDSNTIEQTMNDSDSMMETEETKDEDNMMASEEDSKELPTFTLTELATFNGENGQPAYVAVEGVVYDVSNHPRWQTNEHNGNVAGTDLTEAIKNAPHGTSKLKDLPIVGKLAE